MSLAVLLALVLAACGAGGATGSDAADAVTSSESIASNGSYGGGAVYEEAETDASQSTGSGEKMIHTAYLEMETTEFDQAVTALAALTEELGGYYETSSVGDRGNGYRRADYTVRVPAEQYEVFLNQAGELCHEIWRDASQQNISEVYYDTEGRLRTQQIKLERLQALLEQADNMADIITIESAISETELQIEDLSGTLRHYDDQVDYATVNISLQEVYRLSNTEEAPAGFLERLGSAFSHGGSAFVNTLENLAVALAYGWIWIVLLAAAAVAAFRVLRRRRLRRNPSQKTDDKSGSV